MRIIIFTKLFVSLREHEAGIIMIGGAAARGGRGWWWGIARFEQKIFQINFFPFQLKIGVSNS